MKEVEQKCFQRGTIPAEARILAVADTYCALTEDRPYHTGVKATEALRIIHAARGTKLDAEAVDALVAEVKSE